MRKIKKFLYGTFVYRAYRFFKYLIYPFLLIKAEINNKKPCELAVKRELLDGKELIVTMTSFPDRMFLIHRCLYSLMNQTEKPNRIILWLSEDQFPNKGQDITAEVMELLQFGLEIRWVKGDIRSYKKLIPSLSEFKDAIFVTADDDLYYPKYWLKSLIDAYRKDPNAIHCHLVTRLAIADGKIFSIRCEDDYVDSKTLYNKILGGSGTLYPSNCLHEDVLNEKAFIELAPTSDDIWFWAMALRKGTKIHWIPNNMKRLYYVEGSQEDTPCLSTVNDQNERLFNKHINDVAAAYDLYAILNAEVNSAE